MPRIQSGDDPATRIRENPNLKKNWLGLSSLRRSVEGQQIFVGIERQGAEMESAIYDDGGSSRITAQLVLKEHNRLISNLLNRAGPAQRNLGKDFLKGFLTHTRRGKLSQMKTRKDHINPDFIRG